MAYFFIEGGQTPFQLLQSAYLRFDRRIDVGRQQGVDGTMIPALFGDHFGELTLTQFCKKKRLIRFCNLLKYYAQANFYHFVVICTILAIQP